MFSNLRAIFDVFNIGYYRDIYRRCRAVFTLHTTTSDAECLVDTRGSGFSPKIALIISFLFGSLHLSLMRLSNEDQNKGSKMEEAYQHSEAIERFSEVLGKHKDSYVAQVMEKVMEQSLISLIKSATAKVRLALDDYNSAYQLSHKTDYTAKQNEVIGVQREKAKNIALDDLVRNANARKEIDKIIRVVNIGRGEKEIQNHPLLTIAESTAHNLRRQMDYVETLN